MARGIVVAELKFNRLPAIGAELKRLASRIVSKTAFDAQAVAQRESAVDTGAQRASIYTDTDQGSTYAEAVNAARALRPDARFVEPVRRRGELEAIVSVGVEYAVYNEYDGKAFMGPAAEEVRPSYERAMEEALGRL